MKATTTLSLFLSIVFTAISVTPALTATYLVTPAGTGDYLTIQDAIDASVNGDTILLGPGTFTGTGNKNIDTNGLAIVLTTVSGAENTIIDCESDGRAFYVHGGETGSTVIHDVTVINGEAATLDEKGGAVCCDGASPTILECVFQSNYGGLGGAIYLNDSEARIIRNRFIENNCHTICDGPGGPFSYDDHGAVYCTDSDVTVIDNYFYKNTSGMSYYYQAYGAAIGGKHSTLCIVGNEFDTNGQVQSEGTVHADSCTVEIAGNLFHGNTGEDFACLKIENSTGVVRANYIHDNSSYCIAGGIYGDNSDLSIDFNLIADNGGIGIYTRDAAPLIRRNIVTRGSFVCFENGRGIVVTNSPGAMITNNVLNENALEQTVHGTELTYNGAAPTIESNIFVNSLSVAMVACDATPSPAPRSAAIIDTTLMTDNYFWGNPSGYINSYTYGCVSPGPFGDPLFCDPGNDNWFLQSGSPCDFDTLIIGGGVGGNDWYLHRFNGALPVGCGTPDVLSTTVPVDNSVSPASAGDIYVLSGFAVTNTSDKEAPVYYRLIFGGEAIPFDQGDPLAFVGVTPILQPGEMFTPPEAALIAPDAPGMSAAAVTYQVAYAPAFNMPDEYVTSITFEVPTAVEPSAVTGLVLYQNVPNPFNPATSISFSLPERARVDLSIFNVEGKLVVTLIDGIQPAGPHATRWDGKDNGGVTQSTGVYFYRLQAGDRSLTRKMILLK